MSSDTRLLPRNNLRSTGIPRTTTAVNRPVIGGQGGSGITASPAADRATQAHVKKANDGRVPGVFMPGGRAAAPAPAVTPAEAAARVHDAFAPAMVQSSAGAGVMFNEQEAALIAFLLDAFLSGGSGQLTIEQHQLAEGTLKTLAAMMGSELAAQRMRAAQAGDAPPPIEIADSSDAPSQ